MFHFASHRMSSTDKLHKPGSLAQKQSAVNTCKQALKIAQSALTHAEQSRATYESAILKFEARQRELGRQLQTSTSELKHAKAALQAAFPSPGDQQQQQQTIAGKSTKASADAKGTGAGIASAKPSVRTLAGGLRVIDKVIGQGKPATAGSKVRSMHAMCIV